jgi:hypothetical protein
VHEAALGARALTIVVLRWAADAADATPYITGTPAREAPGQDVVAMAVSGPEGEEAVLRPRVDAPLRPTTLDW